MRVLTCVRTHLHLSVLISVTHLLCHGGVDERGFCLDLKGVPVCACLLVCAHSPSLECVFISVTHLLRHGEVDECGLCLDLRWVVGVGQLGVEEQAEVLVVLHLLVSDHHGTPLFDGLPAEQVVQDRVRVLAQILNQDTVSIGDSSLNRIQVALLPQPDDA